MKTLKQLFECGKAFIKWLLAAVAVGCIGGVTGSIFHESVDFATEFRYEHPWVIFLLPLGGAVIAASYALFKSKGKIDTNRVIEAARDGETVPLVMAPLIFMGTVITHLLGGSAGREGAALQLGGSIGYNMGKVFRLNKSDVHIIVMSGMSSVFAALFGTPLTAAFFALEVTRVGVMHYAGLVPCVISSVTAYKIAQEFGISPVRFDIELPGEFSAGLLANVIVLSLLCAVVSILFCAVIKKTEDIMEKFIPNNYWRAVIGGAIIVILTLVLGTHDYNGAGMEVITRALGGEARAWDFLLKIIFTAVTISAGFKGGEIVPTFFIGSTFGCVAGALLGINPGFAAAIGFTALFCGVVNCPVASVMLACEVFGGASLPAFAVACAVSYMMSGYYGLYKSQKIVYSKLNEDKIDINTK